MTSEQQSTVKTQARIEPEGYGWLIVPAALLALVVVLWASPIVFPLEPGGSTSLRVFRGAMVGVFGLATLQLFRHFFSVVARVWIRHRDLTSEGNQHRG